MDEESLRRAIEANQAVQAVAALLQVLFEQTDLIRYLRLEEPSIHAALPMGLSIAALASETAIQYRLQGRLRGLFRWLRIARPLQHESIDKVEQVCQPLFAIEVYRECLQSPRQPGRELAGADAPVSVYSPAIYVPLSVLAIDDARDTPREVPLDDMLRQSRYPHLLMLGGPGSGKTTALGRLHAACLRADAPVPGLRPLTVPIFVSLRGFTSECSQPIAAWIQQQLDLRCDHRVANDLVDILLTHADLLVLVDGLDEVEAPLRAPLCQHLQREFARHTLIVSCRTAAYRSGYFGTDGSTWCVQPLHRQQIDLLVDHHPTAAEWVRGALDDPHELGQRLREMASTPLFLTLLCRSAQLHTSPLTLSSSYYATCLAELVSRRPIPSTFDRSVLRRLLPLAHASFTGPPWSRARWVDKIRSGLCGEPFGLPDAIMTWLIHGVALLVESIPGSFQISHRGLHEHLAARHLVTEGDQAMPVVLQALAAGAAWHEVVRLWAEEASGPARSTVVADPDHGATLLRLIWRHGVGVPASVLLAAARNPSPEARGVCSLMRDMIPPRSHDAVIFASSTQLASANTLAERLSARGIRVHTDQERVTADPGCALVLCDGDDGQWNIDLGVLLGLVEAGWIITRVSLTDRSSLWPAALGFARRFDLDADFDHLCRWLAVVQRCGRSFTEPCTGIRFRWGRDPDRPRAVGTVTDRVAWFAELLVTNAQAARWGGFAQREPPGEPDQPLVNVAWTETQAFCAWLSSRPSMADAGLVVQLPREALWAAAINPVGDVREWCLDLVDGFRVVRGGDLGRDERESLLQTASAPNLGFRVLAMLRTFH